MAKRIREKAEMRQTNADKRPSATASTQKRWQF